MHKLYRNVDLYNVLKYIIESRIALRMYAHAHVP